MTVEARLWEALRGVEDPEIPVSVVGMGLIVSLAYVPDARRADLQITFTAMGCPAMEFIQDDIRDALLRDPDVDSVEIEVVWDPVWTKDRIRADARARMRSAWDSGVSRADETVWEVFARKEYAEPLHHVGTVTESDEDLAVVSARAIYDEQPWIEMIIVPRGSIREAIRA